MFQLHLWIGLAAALYVVLIGLSGSILVWKHELSTASHPVPTALAAGVTPVGPERAVAEAQRVAPRKQPYYLDFPQSSAPYYVIYLRGTQMRTTVRVHAGSGAVLDVDDGQHGWLNLVMRFHYYLLMPKSRGLLWNGIGAVCLLLLSMSSTVLWWPGIRSWKRGFWIDFRLSFKRVVRDAHNVVGFWALALVSMWAVTGIYFAWPNAVTHTVGAVFRLSSEETALAPATRDITQVGLDRTTAIAAARLPTEHLLGARLALRPNEPTSFYLVAREGMDDSESETVSIAADGTILRVKRHADESLTLGDRIVAALEPLHFGSDWGALVKLIYSAAGLGLSSLAVTGVLMYWHRYLAKR